MPVNSLKSSQSTIRGWCQNNLTSKSIPKQPIFQN